jgi:ribosomal protein S12 methylthiotransferase
VIVVFVPFRLWRKNVSQTIEKLVKESEGLAKNGVKELILIAQDLTYYG